MRIEPRFSEAEVATRVAELAAAIRRDYADAPLVVVCIAEGARRFVDDLFKHWARDTPPFVPERVDVRASRTEGTSLGPVTVQGLDPEQLEDRDVLAIDDIADQGATLRAIAELAAIGEPRSLRMAVLVDKRESRRAPLALDYVGFTLERGWAVGYGMDFDGAHRELDWIGVWIDDRFE